MKPRWRFLVAILLVLMIIAGSLIFPALTLKIVVEPITRGLWLILNLFRAVDQEIYWGLLLVVVFGFGMLMLPKEAEEARRRPPGTAAKPRDAVAEWEQLIAEAGETGYKRELLQRNLNALHKTIGQLVENNDTAELALKARPKRLNSFLHGALDRLRPVKNAHGSLDYEEPVDAFLSSLEDLMEIRYDSNPDKDDDHR
jgi:hypothetical protein